MTTSDTAGAAPEGSPRDAGRIGPFFVLERLGSGGAAGVYAAYDPRLDCRVLIKLLHTPDGPRTTSDRAQDPAQARILRDAQALVELPHPNVVTVHEVGVHEGEVFLAMAFIEGQTLREWIAATPRAWPDVLEVMTAAGYGLAAAHEASIVHRDFKPESVLLGKDRIVCVADFGLAADERQPLGNPLYRAPEQHLAEAASAAADQFSFCLTLYEALVGRYPLDEEVTALPQAERSGEIPRPERGADGERLPPWLCRAVMRGLAADPAKRYPDMDTLLTALVPPRPSRRRLLIAAAVAGLGLASAPLWMRPDPPAAGPCADVATELDAVWSADRAPRVAASTQASIQASEGGDAPDVWTALEPRIEALAATWKEVRTEVCKLSITSDEPETIVALRLHCLDRTRRQLGGVLDVLESADRHVIDRADEMVAALPDPNVCRADPLTFSGAWISPDPAQLRDRDAALDALAGIDALLFVGRYDEAKARLDTFASDHVVPADSSVGPVHDPYVAAQYFALLAGVDTVDGPEHDRAALAAAVRTGDDPLLFGLLLDFANRALARGAFDEAELTAQLGLAVADRMGRVETDDVMQAASKRARAQMNDLIDRIPDPA